MGGGIEEGGLRTRRGGELRFPIQRDYFEYAFTAFIMTRFRFEVVSGRVKGVVASSAYQMKSIDMGVRRQPMICPRIFNFRLSIAE
jgi:hypothetical protein